MSWSEEELVERELGVAWFLRIFSPRDLSLDGGGAVAWELIAYSVHRSLDNSLEVRGRLEY